MFTPEIEVVATAVAKVVKASKKFAKAEFDAAALQLAEDAEKRGIEFQQYAANLGRISNVSAVRQELEQAGIIHKAKTESAFTIAVAKAMA
jgi:hypothetical protein